MNMPKIGCVNHDCDKCKNTRQILKDMEQAHYRLQKRYAELESKVGAVAQAWDEGYRAGIDDERTSEANIGIAGMGMKIEPARNNPYRTTPPSATEK